MSTPWKVPAWCTPEDIERYETLVEALRDVRDAAREAILRIEPGSSVAVLAGLEMRMSAITRDADEWAVRLNRLGCPSEEPGPSPEESAA